MEMSTGKLNKLYYHAMTKMSDSKIEKLQELQEKEIQRLQKEIDRLLEELRIIDRQENREDDC